MKVTINFSKRWLYTFIAIGILAIIGVGVYAVAGVSHTLDEVNLPSCSDGQVLGMSGGSWSCVEMPSGGGGITEEVDPTVKSWAKTDNPTIPGTVSADIVKISGSEVAVLGSCISSQWGEIRRCYSEEVLSPHRSYDLYAVCACTNFQGEWRWWIIVDT